MAASSTGAQTQSSSWWNRFTDIIKIWDLWSLLLKLGIAVLIVILLLFLSKLLSDFVKKKLIANLTSEKDEYSRKVAVLISDIVFYILIVFSIFIWFEILWFNVWVILGWISFWIWFAFKEILGNMIAWIMILTTKEFKLWDIIEVQDWSNFYFWRIEEITIRYTLIRTLELRKVIMPNLNLITLPIKTFTSEDFVRLETILSVHYDTDLEKASEVIKEAINWLDFIIEKDKTKILVDTFGDSWIILKA